MSGFDTRDGHIDVPLTNMMIKWVPENHIVQDIYPVVTVNHQDGLIWEWSKGDAYRDHDTKRSPATTGHFVEYGVSSLAYHCTNYSLGTMLTNEELANTDNQLNLKRSYAEFLKTSLSLNEEIRVASQITSGQNMGSYTTLTTTDQFNDPNSDPVGQVDTGKESIRSTTGLKANLMIIGHQVFRQLMQHPQIIDRIQTTILRDPTKETLAQVFNVDRILIGESMKNDAEEGQPIDMVDVWGKNLILLRMANATAQGRSPSFGYALRWKDPALGRVDMSIQIGKTNWLLGAQAMRGMYYADEKITAAELGYLIEDAVA